VGGAAPEEPPGEAPEPGAVEPGITGAGGAAHGTLEVFGELVVGLVGAVGFATDPRLRSRSERLWCDRLPSRAAGQRRCLTWRRQVRAAWEGRSRGRYPDAALAPITAPHSAHSTPRRSRRAPRRGARPSGRSFANDVFGVRIVTRTLISPAPAVRTTPLRGSPGRLRSGTTVPAASSTSHGSPTS
jgi:hypothetical protein